MFVRNVFISSNKLQPCKVNCSFTQFHYENSRVGFLFSLIKVVLVFNFVWISTNKNVFIYFGVSSIADTYTHTHTRFLRNNNKISMVHLFLKKTQSIKRGKLL